MDISLGKVLRVRLYHQCIECDCGFSVALLVQALEQWFIKTIRMIKKLVHFISLNTYFNVDRFKLIIIANCIPCFRCILILDKITW